MWCGFQIKVLVRCSFISVSLCFYQSVAPIAQLGERQTEDLKVPGSIPGLGMLVRVHMMLCAEKG